MSGACGPVEVLAWPTGSYLSVRLDTWEVDLGQKADLRRLVRVVGATVDLERVDPVLEDRVSGSNDRGVPV